MTSEKKDANDVAVEMGESMAQHLEALGAEAMQKVRMESGLYFSNESDFRYGNDYPPPVIEGLLREHEILTLIAPPKAAKSWLLMGLAYQVILGGHFLIPQWKCAQGNVLYIDNELDERLFNARRRIIREKLGLSESLNQHMAVWHIRDCPDDDALRFVLGRLPLLKGFDPRVIFVDSSYYMYGPNKNENQPSDVSIFYRGLRKMARFFPNASIILIHHASKGNQSEKEITDVGSGSGAAQRATDTHMILREHTEADCYVVESVCRSWPQPKPIVLRRTLEKGGAVIWKSTEHNPAKLRKKGARPGFNVPVEDLDEAAFVSYLEGDWISKEHIVQRIWDQKSAEGIGEKKCRLLVSKFLLKYGLDDLQKEDGVKDCGAFEAEKNPGKGAGIKFRLKPVGKKEDF